MPFFYKSLKKEPRQSGFLDAERGAQFPVRLHDRGSATIGRSTAATMRPTWGNISVCGAWPPRGFPGKPNAKSDFNVILYGVNDKLGEGGYLLTAEGHTELPWGFTARGSLNQLSSFQFRQEFSQSFYEAVFSESHSIGFLTKHWSSFDFNIVASGTRNSTSRRPAT